MKPIKAVILAAGEGKRMKSSIPKVLHKVCGIEMVQRVLNVCPEGCEAIVVVGHGKEKVEPFVEKQAKVVEQKEQKGTGHAVQMAGPYLAGYRGKTLVLAGDMPVLKKQTLETLIAQTPEHGAALLTSIAQDPIGYGRVLRDAQGHVKRIVEHKDATEEERQVKEVNASVYCFDNEALLEGLSQLTCNNAQHEYYLTDCIEYLVNKNRVVTAVVADQEECMGVNDRLQLAQAERYVQETVKKKHMQNGVTMIDPAQVYIEEAVEIGQDTVLYPGVILKGNSKIGSRCVLMGSTRIQDSEIGDDTEVQNSVIVESTVGCETTVGPFAYLRPNSHVGSHCKVGDFVEVKNATVGDGTKLPHLAYIGDADIGGGCNIACGTIFVNYDGKIKHRTTVEDHCFIGCNVNLVAPVTVREGAYVAAGTTVTSEIPAGSMAIGRARAEVKEHWAEERRKQGKLK